MDRLTARSLRRHAGHEDGAQDAALDHVTLDYEARFLRRRALRTDGGREVMVDLPETVSLEDGDALETEAGLVGVIAAAEPLIEVRAAPHDLTRLAWHVGNRHTPAQIEADRLLIREDAVLADMLERLGAQTRAVREPFRPEGGAYGLGRTHGHHHGGATDHPHHDH
jgi:urease accessory protein